MDDPLDGGSNPAAFTSDKEEQQDWSSSLDQEDPETPHIKEELEDSEPPYIKEELEDPEPPYIKEDEEDPEPPYIKEELEDPEPPYIKEELEDPEPPYIKEELEDPEPPYIKEELEDPELPHINKDQEDPEPPHINKDQEDPEPPHIKEDQEDPEPPHINKDQEDPEPPHINKDQEETGIKFPFAPVTSEEYCGGPEPATWESSDEDDGGSSEPEGFDSCDEEYYQNNMDPFEDGEESPLPATRFPPSKRSRRARRHPQPPALSWKTEKDPDTAPPVSGFEPAQTPGPRLGSASTRTPLDLFKLFFPEQTVQTLCRNTNKQAAQQIANGKKFKWVDLDVEYFYKYIGLLLYMAVVKLDSILDYWRQNHFLSLSLPSEIMPRERYRTISWNLQLSDPDEDVLNDRKKGTDEHDELFQLNPLMDTIKGACKAFYHPYRDLAVNERMVASKANTGRARHKKAKLTNWGFKLFVLADSRNGYTVDFSIHTDKSHIPSGHGLSYDVVMSLVQPGYLGTGYHIYMDHFFTSPKLFMALHESRFAACGTYREYRKGCPRTDVNALTKESARGSVRWIRDGPIVFVKWMDTGVCSTIHLAYSGKTVQMRVKQQDGSWKRASVPCPTPVAEYNEHMGGVDPSDQLTQYYSAQHKTLCWYRNLFYHFLDIATTNSFVLHKELCLAQQTKPMTHRGFMEQLTAELCGKPLCMAPVQLPADHLPVPSAGPGMKATTGRRKCEHCRSQGQQNDTVWKCMECDVALCLELDRNCFAAWHDCWHEKLKQYSK